MAEHTKASTQGSAHARYVAYREQGYTPQDAYRLSGSTRRGPALGYCAEGCGQPAAFTIGKLAYCRDCDPHDQPHVNVSFG